MNRAEQLADIKLYISSGWELKDETPEHFLLVKRAGFWKHFWMFMFTWWTFGMSNLLLGLVCSKDKKIMK